MPEIIIGQSKESLAIVFGTLATITYISRFGTVAWIDVKEYEALEPDQIAVDREQNLKELNAAFSKPLKDLLSAETEVDGDALISIDSKGLTLGSVKEDSSTYRGCHLKKGMALKHWRKPKLHCGK
ncbi:hypothetical protein F3Y22_tig00110450pilonHSYRG00243 [Hibiscus syriacus]|uniref:Uncharacterized protein n=1 Tax=Hibiscus syriacus TaxID=106335 RepID=A0A6A3AKS2_HIBSY|nr:hypothetical protein F3Y22_tig00110450pilonHSYRG00243 [Hibiscus syriacus]